MLVAVRSLLQMCVKFKVKLSTGKMISFAKHGTMYNKLNLDHFCDIRQRLKLLKLLKYIYIIEANKS